MDNSTKRLFEVVDDDLDEVLSQAVDKHEREEAFCNDGLDESDCRIPRISSYTA